MPLYAAPAPDVHWVDVARATFNILLRAVVLYVLAWLGWITFLWEGHTATVEHCIILVACGSVVLWCVRHVMSLFVPICYGAFMDSPRHARKLVLLYTLAAYATIFSIVLGLTAYFAPSIMALKGFWWTALCGVILVAQWYKRTDFDPDYH